MAATKKPGLKGHMTATQIADRYGISHQLVAQWRRAGKLPFRRDEDGRYYYPVPSVKQVVGWFLWRKGIKI